MDTEALESELIETVSASLIAEEIEDKSIDIETHVTG